MGCRRATEPPGTARDPLRSVDSSLLALRDLRRDGCFVHRLARVDRAKFCEPVSRLDLDPVEPLTGNYSLVDVGEQDLLAFFFRQNYFHCLPHSFLPPTCDEKSVARFVRECQATFGSRLPAPVPRRVCERYISAPAMTSEKLRR